MGRVAVIMPTYNERENLEAMTGRVRAAVPEADLLVVDDNSPDGTGELADKLAAEDSHVRVLHRPGKGGLGAAYLAGFSWALDQDYGAVVEMDADGSHQPEQLPLLLDALRHADLVLGSRWVPGGRVVNWPKSREALSRGANIYARLMLGIPLKDATGGYRAYRTATLRAIGLDEIQSQGYCFQVDLALRALNAGLRVVEVPITFVERVHGSSKMSKSIMVEAFWLIGRWGLACPGRWAPAARRGPAHHSGPLSCRRGRRGGQHERPGPARAVQDVLSALAVPGVVLARGFLAPLAPDQGQPLREYFLQIGDGPALPQHVPVAPRRLGLPRRGQVARGRERGHAAHPALPGSRNLSLGGKRDGKVVTLGAVESYLLAWCQIGVTVVLVARRPEPGAAKCAFGH